MGGPIHAVGCKLECQRSQDVGLVCKGVADWPDRALVVESARDTPQIDINVYKKQHDHLWDDGFVDIIGNEYVSDRRPYAARNSSVFSVIPGECIFRHPDLAETSTKDDNVWDNLKRMCDYVAEIQLRQHRAFVFTLYIHLTSARLMRFDRSGVVMSLPIDLKTEPEKLYEFFYRLRNATDAELGYDPTATMVLPTDPDVTAVQRAISILPSSRVKFYIEKAFNDDQWPFYRLQVPDPKDPTLPHVFLIRNLSSHGDSLTGRATKGYIAFDLATKEFCFLKDSWRLLSDDIHPELEVYKRLAHAGAWKAGVLHRDVSDGNIMIYEDPTTRRISGLLIDWDLCKYKEELSRGKTQKTRSGTWRYLSATLLNFPKKPYELADDIESFLHLLCIFALRFHHHNLDPVVLKVTLDDHYDVSWYQDGYCLGSYQKLSDVRGGLLPCTLRTKDTFSTLLQVLAAICKEHYASLDFDDLQEQFGITPETAASASVEPTEYDSAPPIVPAFSDIDERSRKENAQLEADLPLPKPAVATLNTHSRFAFAFYDALTRDGWIPHDKTVDQFEKINRRPSSTGTSGSTGDSIRPKRGRRAFVSLEGEDHKSVQPSKPKKQKISATSGPSRVTRVIASGSGLQAGHHAPP
ncbi:hypothetical protein EUX98_g4181 [Antrodiella citrinella]|uniref:Fungal-type protein kinase domain-containing protein n=1 Tax=Antrodiella citrinella TaxID=2447956 RepID=A0A4S4MX61_9APHY|nr:hypothetical protein EUX98_g4181 [Antrodiella citrinella]